MSAIDFVHGFTSDDISTIVTNFFDEIMVLYNLIGHRHDLDICTDKDTSIATFMLLMDSDDDAISLYDNLNNSEFSVYDNRYSISMSRNGASVRTEISKVIPN